MDDMDPWESRARQVITALVQRLESHGDSCVEGCWNDARDMQAILDAIEFLDTNSGWKRGDDGPDFFGVVTSVPAT